MHAVECVGEFDLAAEARVITEVLEFFQQLLFVVVAGRQPSEPSLIHKDMTGGTGADTAADCLDAVIEITQRIHQR